MKETKLEIPAGCEVDKIETQEGHIVVTFREKERQLPKSWEEFCEMFPLKKNKEHYINSKSEILHCLADQQGRNPQYDKNVLTDRVTAEAVLALCQLIQLQNCYNRDWVPDWTDEEKKYTIDFYQRGIWSGEASDIPSILTFKSRELRDEFLRNFRPLIEKLKPLYGIKEGGEE